MLTEGIGSHITAGLTTCLNTITKQAAQATVTEINNNTNTSASTTVTTTNPPPAASSSTTTTNNDNKKKVLLLGAGRVAGPALQLLLTCVPSFCSYFCVYVR